MLAKILSGTTVGLDGVLVEVEVEVVQRGLPSFKIVGLPGKAVEEAKERVRSAIINSGALFPKHRITINLAPADLPKVGPSFDLPIALGILAASNQLPKTEEIFLVAGELSLDGSVRPIHGVFPLTLLAQEQKILSFFIGEKNAAEASLVRGVKVRPVKNLKQLVVHFAGVTPILPAQPVSWSGEGGEAEFDFSEIKGQEQAKRAAEIAAAGGHNLFLKGLPGSGKTMIARALPGILPPLGEEEVLELTRIYSVVGLMPADGAVRQRPFRSPHHSVSKVGLVGGGSHPQPGEITLAHRGVLFLDELPEYPRSVIESLRQPLEDGRISISRAAGRMTFPAEFMLVAASNPCPCGWLGSEKKECVCTPSQIIRYQQKMSGPILDRIDLHVDVSLVPVEKLTADRVVSESSASIRQRVIAARKAQRSRYKNQKGVLTNSQLKGQDLVQFCPLSTDSLLLLKQAVSELGLTARGYNKIIKLSRTIADLAGEQAIKIGHVAEALQYRPKD